jgi:hypothetical protein
MHRAHLSGRSLPYADVKLCRGASLWTLLRGSAPQAPQSCNSSVDRGGCCTGMLTGIHRPLTGCFRSTISTVQSVLVGNSC